MTAAMLLLPLAAALLLALLPERLRAGTLRRWLRLGGAVAALLLALAVILSGAEAGTPWLGRHAALFTVLLAYTLAAAAATADDPVRPGWSGRRRDAPLAVPALVAAAALAASPLATVALSQLALLLLTTAEDGWAGFANRQTLPAGAACQAVALLGAALLAPMPAAPAPAAGALLLGLGVAGLGLLAPGLRPAGRSAATLAAGSGLVALALTVLLRLRAAGSLPPAVLTWAGPAWLLIAALDLWRLPPGDIAVAAALALCGGAVAGLGIGGAAATAGLLLLTASLLALAACTLAQTLAAGHVLRPLSIAMLALLPPSGGFAAARLLLAAAMRDAPLATLPLATGLALICLRLAASRSATAGTGPQSSPWPVAALLLCNLLIGLALPSSCLDWLARAGSVGG